MIFRKERLFKDIVNDTFSFAGENARSLFFMVFIFASPFALVSSYFYAKIQLSEITSSSYGNPALNLAGYYGSALLANVMMILCVYGYVYFYIKQGKGNFTRDDVWGYMTHHVTKILGAVITMVFIIILGIIVLIIPGIYLAVIMMLMFAVLLYEQVDYPVAFMRSIYLTRDRWWYTLGVILFINGLVLVFGMLLMVPEFALSFVLKSKVASELGPWPVRFAVVTTATQYLVFFLQVIPQIAIILHYFNLSEEKERLHKSGQEQVPGEQEQQS